MSSASAILAKAEKDVARVMEKALADITKLEGASAPKASKAPAKPKASAPVASKTSTVTLAVVKKALEGKNSAKARTFYCIDTKKVGARSTLEKENSHYTFHEREDDGTFVRVCGTKLTPKVLSALGFSEVKKPSTPEPLLNEESDEEEEAEEEVEDEEEEVEDDEEEVDEAEEGEEDEE